MQDSFKYHWVEGNGVEEFSTRPRYQRVWWDWPPSHLVVSYATWAKNIVRAFTINR